MKLAVKLTLGAGVVAVALCGLAYATGDDDRRNFIHGSSGVTQLPKELFMVDQEVDDEYDDDDTDEEEDVRAAQVAPVVAVNSGITVVVEATSAKVRGPEMDEDEDIEPRKVLQVNAMIEDNNNTVDST